MKSLLYNVLLTVTIAIVIIGLHKALFKLGKHGVRNHLVVEKQSN